MKIVHLYWGLSFGGIETMLVNIANLQFSLGNDIYIILINDVYERTLLDSIDKGIHVIQLKRTLQSKSPWFILRLNYHLNLIRPDVIHLHDTYLYNLLLPKYRHISCSTLHAMPSGRTKYGSIKSNKLLFSMSELFHRLPGNVQSINMIPKVFSISQSVHKELLANYNVESKVINNGIITSNFRQKEHSDFVDVFKIIQVSRLEHENKGQDLLINAIAILIGKGVNVNVTFVGDGNSLDYLKELSMRLNVCENVKFLGKCTQDFIADNLYKYDLFVQPSRFEGFGLTVAESMAASLPVLVSSGQGPAELTCGSKYGWVFENNMVIDLAEKINFIINNYSEAILKSVSARKYVIDNYDVSVTAKKYLKSYKD